MYARQAGEMNHNAKLSKSDVENIRKILKIKNLTYQDIGEKFGVSKSCIKSIRSGDAWSEKSRMKTCTTCKEQFHPDNFYADRNVCKTCTLSKQKSGYENRDTPNRVSAEWLRRPLTNRAGV